MNLHAEAAEGYRFVKWVDANDNTVGPKGSAPSVSLVYTPGSAFTVGFSTGIFSGYWGYKDLKDLNL